MRFIPTEDRLIIRLEGFERLWALRTRLEIPRSAIVQVDYLDDRPIMQDFWGYLRIPGTSIPWRFLAGTFWQKGDREFWFVRMKQLGLMTIETKPKECSYSRLRISCDAEVAQEIVDWWHDRKN